MKKRLGPATLLLLFFAASTTSAQGLLGGIAGTVTDSTGAVVGGAKVTAKNPATNFAVTALTQSNGLYPLPHLQAGTYTVSISQPGFQTVVNSQILILAERTATVNASLQSAPALTLGLIQQTLGGPPVLQLAMHLDF